MFRGCLDVRNCKPRRIYGDAAVEALKLAATVCGVNLRLFELLTLVVAFVES